MQSALESLPGVASVDVSYEDKTATVKLSDPGKFSVEEALKKLKEMYDDVSVVKK